MNPPSFWSHGRGGLPSLLLSPIAQAVERVASRRSTHGGEHVGIPVFCCGNATTGGAGKTTVALDLLDRLAKRGLRPHAISRGHGGRRHHAPLRVDPTMDARLTGDEPLLLARTAPTWISRDRVSAARAAWREGAGSLVMDDGLQNFGLHKDCSLLVIDGEQGFGNGRVLPAGPLRERPLDALSRCRAVVLIGDDRTGVASLLRGHRPILRASLRQSAEVDRLRGKPILAFAGIGRPSKFFDSLVSAGVTPRRFVALPDHHVFSGGDIARLLAIRDQLGSEAVLATTHKDAVRLPPALRDQTVAVGVSLIWSDRRIEHVIDAALGEC